MKLHNHYSSVIELFMDLVKIDSPTGKEKHLANLVYDLLRNWGLEPQIDSHNNVYVCLSNNHKYKFFSAHLDTVQPGESIEPIIKNGWLKSAGHTILGADNKASVAAILFMLQEISRGQIASNNSVEVVFTTSEEIGNYGAIGFDKSKLKAEVGYIFDSSSPVGTIVSESPFYARFDISIQGKAAHAGYPEFAQPAVPVLLELVTSLEKLRTQELLINIGKINGGEARNTVIGQIQLEGEIRSVDQNLFNTAMKELEHILSKKYSVEIAHEIVIENGGYRHQPHQLATIKANLEKIIGHGVEVVSSAGVSDANIFNELDHLNVYNIGDGTLDSHTVDERIKVSDLKKLASLVIGLATK